MRFLEQWNLSEGNASINHLLELLRTHLREELNLENNIPSIKIFRFENRHHNMPLKRRTVENRRAP